MTLEKHPGSFLRGEGMPSAVIKGMLSPRWWCLAGELGLPLGSALGSVGVCG